MIIIWKLNINFIEVNARSVSVSVRVCLEEKERECSQLLLQLIGMKSECESVFRGKRDESARSRSHSRSFSVPGAGIEPAQHCCHWCLRPARLPIPPSGLPMIGLRKYKKLLSFHFCLLSLSCFFTSISLIATSIPSASYPHSRYNSSCVPCSMK
jgi:hypothetical protein